MANISYSDRGSGAEDHPSRAKSDCYYINNKTLLRAHMTAHQIELLCSGLDNFLMIGDVYRRDEIDSTHFPVFHQVDAVRSQRKEQLLADHPDLELFEATFDPHTFKNSISDPMKQSCHTLEATKLMEAQLKNHLIGLVKILFGENIKHRWVNAYFPFTHPSWELEIYYEKNWLEVLGCGICINDISFWLPPNLTIDNFTSNDFYDLVRNVGGDIIEQVKLKDKFVHPKSKKHSLCYSIVYRHLERTLTQAEVNKVHKMIERAAEGAFNIVIR
ncbi:unnamed protein product, partial [Iphiclides podalirius]